MKTIKAKMMAFILAAVMAVGLVGCGVDISGIGLPTDLVLEKGESQQLEIQYSTNKEVSTAEVAELAEKLTLDWSSSDESVVTVDDSGLVTAVGTGEADVTVTTETANISSTTHIKVVILPTGVSAPESLELELNGEATKALDAKMTPEDATEVKLTYESSDESVATVDENGNVTAVGVGDCIITTKIVADTSATNESADVDSEMLVVPENMSAETKVTVVKVIESITLDDSEGILTVGNKHKIDAIVEPEDATNKTVIWESSDDKVATVDENGNVTAQGTGQATITASSPNSEASASYELTVQNVTCSYCGQTGHTSASCPVKAADQQAAAQAAQAQAAAQAAAQQQAAEQAAQQQAAASGGGSASAPAAPSEPAPAPDPQPSGGESSGGGYPDDYYEQGQGGSLGGTVITGGGNGVGVDAP